MEQRTVYLNGFSKNCAMTGMRVAYACGPADIIGAMTKIHQYTMLSAPTTSQFAALEAVLSGERSIETMRKEYERRRDLVVRRFNEMDIPCPYPQGAFYAFPSLADIPLEPQEFCEQLLKEEKVAVVPGSAFGPGGAQHIRVSYATGYEKLSEALNKIENFLRQIRSNSDD